MQARLLRQDFLGGLAVIAVAVFAYWMARNLPAGAAGGIGPGSLPKALAVLLGGLGVVLLLNSFHSESLARWSVRGPLFVLGALVRLRPRRATARLGGRRTARHRGRRLRLERGALARDAGLRRRS